MIGYIKIYKPELKVKDLQVYESYYCGVCKSLKNRYGLFKNMTLNNDSVFISLLIDSLNNLTPISEPFRCAYNPVKRKIRVVNNSTDYISDLNIYLVYKKLIDDYVDEKNVISFFGSLALKKAGKKAGKRIGGLKKIIDVNLNKLYKNEQKKCSDSEQMANIYGNIIKEICSYKFLNDKNLFIISSHIGYNIGKWVYLIDAFDDLEKDLKNKSYNPYLLEYNYNNDMDILTFKTSIKDSIRKKLYLILDEAVKAYELIEENKFSPIIYNILLEGIFNKTNEVMEGKCDCGKKSI